ncbi:MAG: ABC transporter [Ilumatobacter coccineus]|uniref:ABC transporter n=1 Tax=Ilumatobacter coccineus TaxID=467094 RepID=A0A2G6KG11_9ACTN|nr:MAG: ABC transporter [Ilumatobacter coccineus]
MLNVAEITVAFGDRTVLDRVSLTVNDGETVALLGPSGSGKSTLLRVIAGLIVPDHGRVVIDGTDVTSLATHKRSVGMVFQSDQLFPHLDVAANVGFGLKMAKMPAAQRRERVAEMLDLVGLSGFGDRSIDRLSGGETKRVALARSLAPAPRVLLLDEPLTGLDRDLHDRLMVEVAEILDAASITSVWVTHDREEAATVASRTHQL